MRYKGRGTAGRCGERIERRRWRMKRDERVAAVKILSVRRKAAQKFWAPQQDHRPLRRVARSACEESPSHGFACPAPFRQGGLWGRGMRIATTSVRAGFAMTYYKKCGGRWHTWVPPYIILFCRAGPACPAAAPGKKNPPVTALPCQPPLKGAGSCEA